MKSRITIDGETQQGPLRTPWNPPPSHPNPSHVGHAIERYPAMQSLGGGHGGSDRAWEPSHGTSGGSDRAWGPLHGRHGASMNQGTRRSFPTPWFLPPSNPHPAKVGDGLCIIGDGDVGAAGGGGSLRTMSLAELLEQFTKSARATGSAHTTAYSSPSLVQILQPKISNPCGQLRTALV